MTNRPKVSYLADRIRNARRSIGLSQDELGEILGVSDKTISAYEVGRAIPPLPKLLKLAEATQKPISYFSEENPSTALDIDERLRAVETLLEEIKKLVKNQKTSENLDQ